MRREELSIPAITNLRSEDATAIRAIVSALTREIYELRLEVDILKSEQQERTYRNMMSRGRR
jgi:hypothetical protein